MVIHVCLQLAVSALLYGDVGDRPRKWPSRQLIKRKIIYHVGEQSSGTYRNFRVKVSCLVCSLANLHCPVEVV